MKNEFKNLDENVYQERKKIATAQFKADFGEDAYNIQQCVISNKHSQYSN